MVKKNPDITREYGQLTPQFLHELGPNIPTRRTVYGPKGGEHHWRQMLDGDPVEWWYIQTFLQYLEKKTRITPVQAKNAAERVDSVMGQMYDPYYPDTWVLGWEGIVKWLGAAKNIPPTSKCRDRLDFHEMATIILESIGRKGTYRGHTLSESSAIKAGERFAGLNYDGFLKWLPTLCNHNPSTTMFSVANVIQGASRCWKRIGVTIILPLTQSAYMEFREGKIPYYDITPDMIHIEGSASEHLLLHSFSELPPAKFKNQKKISQAQLRTALYQMAVLSPLQLQKNVSPKLLCLAPLPEHQKRALDYGFNILPAIEPATKSGICELLPNDGGNYVALMAMLCAWQWLHRPEVQEDPA